MSGINQHVVYSVTRICSEFCSDLGNEPIKSFGTGFFIKSQDDETIFVTNKHMLDPSLSLGATKGYSLKSIELQLRSKSNLSHTKFIILTSYKIENSRDSDVSVIYDIEIPPDNNYDYISPHVFPISDLADEDFFQNTLKIVDPASFIGFAGTRSSSWWDTGNNLPIARHANIASLPQINFNNPSIKTTEVILVSGFSFQGSSGSPTFSHLKKNNITPENYSTPKIIGIMSGHMIDDQYDEMFNHTGLSYFTKSTALLALLANLTGLKSRSGANK